MKKQCVCCGRHIREEANKLWCDKCLEKVHAELRGESDLPLHFFFKWNLRHKK